PSSEARRPSARRALNQGLSAAVSRAMAARRSYIRRAPTPCAGAAARSGTDVREQAIARRQRAENATCGERTPDSTSDGRRRRAGGWVYYKVYFFLPRGRRFNATAEVEGNPGTWCGLLSALFSRPSRGWDRIRATRSPRRAR